MVQIAVRVPGIQERMQQKDRPLIVTESHTLFFVKENRRPVVTLCPLSRMRPAIRRVGTAVKLSRTCTNGEAELMLGTARWSANRWGTPPRHKLRRTPIVGEAPAIVRGTVARPVRTQLTIQDEPRRHPTAVLPSLIDYDDQLQR
jgi:hypothetical protein